MRPPGVTLAQHFYTYFENVQPQIKQEEEMIEEVVFKSPFASALSSGSPVTNNHVGEFLNIGGTEWYL